MSKAFLFFTTSRLALKATQWVPDALYPACSGGSLSLTPPSNAYIKNMWSLISTLCIHHHRLKLRHRDKLAFTVLT
jgi:hypothetical protein